MPCFINLLEQFMPFSEDLGRYSDSIASCQVLREALNHGEMGANLITSQRDVGFNLQTSAKVGVNQDLIRRYLGFSSESFKFIGF